MKHCKNQKDKKSIIIVITAVVILSIIGGFYVISGLDKDNEEVSEAYEDVQEEYVVEENEVIESVVEEEQEEEIEGVEEQIWDYISISEQFVGTSSIEQHTVGFGGGTVRAFYNSADGEYLWGYAVIQEYDGNPETIFICDNIRCYRYEDILSYEENIMIVYNSVLKTEDEIEYIDEETIRIRTGDYEAFDTLTEPYEMSGDILNEDEIKISVEQIREWYYSTQDNIANGTYKVGVESDSVKSYGGNLSSTPTKVVIDAGVGGIDYTREYYFSDESSYALYFIFAYNSNGDEYRIYIEPDDTYVIRYIENDTVYEMGDIISDEMETLKDYLYAEGYNCIPA